MGSGLAPAHRFDMQLAAMPGVMSIIARPIIRLGRKFEKGNSMTVFLRATSAYVLATGLSIAPLAAHAGCVSGAAVGGVAGHVAGHHAVAGAAIGCAVGHHKAHEAKKAAAAQANQAPPPAGQPHS